MQVDPIVQEVIVWVLGVIVGYFGPGWIQVIKTKLGLTGQWAVLLLYGIAFALGLAGVGAAVLACSVPLLNVCLDLGDGAFFKFVVAVTGAASFAYNRLKDQGKI